MNKRIGAALATLGLAAGVGVATAPMASANQSFSCKATEPYKPTLHAYATRINYGGGRSAIYLSGDTHVVQVLPLASDPQWNFHMATSSGLQSRYHLPTQWGSPSNPLDFNTRIIRVEWSGKTGNFTTMPRHCYIRVGV